MGSIILKGILNGNSEVN